ncbi:MAG: hypothetical protein J7M03_01240, partial [Candidatus Desulfofervidaceae bacterium]|nr:hypothetical protein [Candidatus Desulfofervidaceae bacterium]
MRLLGYTSTYFPIYPLIAFIGFILAAFKAGLRPEALPTIKLIIKAKNQIFVEKAIGIWPSFSKIKPPITAKPTPIPPPPRV